MREPSGDFLLAPCLPTHLTGSSPVCLLSPPQIPVVGVIPPTPSDPTAGGDAASLSEHFSYALPTVASQNKTRDRSTFLRWGAGSPKKKKRACVGLCVGFPLGLKLV